MFNWLKKWFRIKPHAKKTELKSRFNLLEKKLGFKIQPEHAELYKRALRHRSIVDNSRYNPSETYERLEFLGDAVLDLIVTEILYEKFPTENEGFLTKLRAKIVRGDTLYELSKKLGLNEFLEIGDRAAGQGIELSKSVLSDVYEALIAAIYVTEGYQKAFEFVQWNLDQFLDFEDVVTKIDNHKSLLMEYSQSEKMSLPKYVVLSEDGPGHDKTFHIAVYIDNRKLGEGKGKSKKNAEQLAAKNALKHIFSH